MKQKINHLGFSGLELLLVLSIVGLLLYFSLTFADSVFSQARAQNVAQQAYDYSKTATRYIQTHRAMLQETLFDSNRPNNKIITVSMQVLKAEKFIKHNYPEINILKQYPCLIIYGDNQQLQAFLYYRSDGNDIKLNQRQLDSGLQHIGSMLGLYQNGVVTGAARDWSYTHEFVKNRFISQSSVPLYQSANKNNYQCRGRYIANNSYVVNITTMLTLTSKLPKDDSLHQYPDALSQVDDQLNNNTMNDDLSMDYRVIDGRTGLETRYQSNVIFQMNAGCEINPRKPETMQEFNPYVDGSRPENRNSPNNLGCKNRQLSIGGTREGANLNMQVTGFNQSAVNPLLYVGDISAASVQPTELVSIGTPCGNRELGKMARQIASNDNNVNNLYISQVQCMQNPLCPDGTNNKCYMPINSVTINMRGNISTTADDKEDEAIRWSCPVGLYPELPSIKFDWPPRPRTHPHSFCDWGINIPPIAKCKVWFDTQKIICLSFIMRTKWQEGGGSACLFDRFMDSYGGSFRINCTNDASRIPVIIIQ
jgi:type II secretory pathway pseudopilin PulG